MTITIKKKKDGNIKPKKFNGFDDFQLQGKKIKKSLIIYKFPIYLSLHDKNFNSSEEEKKIKCTVTKRMNLGVKKKN